LVLKCKFSVFLLSLLKIMQKGEVKYNIDFRDETYSSSQTETYSVNIQISRNNIAFAVFDREREKYVHLRQKQTVKNTTITEIDINNFIEDNPIIKKSKQKKILWYSQKSVIVPAVFYLEEKQTDILNFNTPVNRDFKVLNNKLKTNDYNIFAINQKQFNVLKKHIPDATIYNQGSLLINNALFSNISDRIKLQLDAGPEFIDIALVKKTKLLFRNTFEYKSASDFVFFVLNIFDKLKLNIDKTDVYISGEIDSISPETVLLKNYIKKIKYKFPDYNYSYTFNDIKISKFTQLLNLENCE